MNELTILTSLLRKVPATLLCRLDVQAATQTVHIAECWAGFSWITLVLLKGFAKPGVVALTRTFNKLFKSSLNDSFILDSSVQVREGVNNYFFLKLEFSK